jgi:hypothetical protein
MTVPAGPGLPFGQVTISYEVQRSFRRGGRHDRRLLAVQRLRDGHRHRGHRRRLPGDAAHPVRAAAPVVTTSRTRGLLEGQPITINVTGLKRTRASSGRVRQVPRHPQRAVRQLRAAHAHEPDHGGGGPRGNMSFTAPAVLRFDAIFPPTPHPVYCRDQCRIGLFAQGASLEVPYTMATGTCPSARRSG